jgi:integrase
MAKIDPHENKKHFENWKNRKDKNGKTIIADGIPNITKENSDILLKYLGDMELGLNMNRKSKKGARSYSRINACRSKLMMIMRESEHRYTLKSILAIEEIQVMGLFKMMRDGEIKNRSGHIYKSTGDYVKSFRAFWNWWRKVNRKNGIEIKDITEDLDTYEDKPQWVYLNEKQMKILIENVKQDYRVLFTFLYDSGIRSPTELVNVKVGDFTEDYKKLNIRDETSKTFGRKISIMFSRDLIREHVKKKNLTAEDYVFQIKSASVNQYLKKKAGELFGGEERGNISEGGEKFRNMTMYDIRHISCCYWLPRYKSESALKYRFGWIKSDRVHYYSEFIGMKDNITEEDLLIDVTKTQLESELVKMQRENDLVSERLKIIEGFLKEYAPHIKELYKKKYGSDEYVI